VNLLVGDNDAFPIAPQKVTLLPRNSVWQGLCYDTFMDRDRWSARQEFLWKFLRGLRIESNQTQKQLAVRLRRPQTYVSKYELGERRLDLLELCDICNACGITLAELVSRIEPDLIRHDRENAD